MSDEETRPRGITLTAWRLDQVEKKVGKLEEAIRDFADGQTKIKERMTIIAWILVAAAAFFNIISPEMMAVIGPAMGVPSVAGN